MRTETALIAFLALAPPAAAQAPLSAIDWLNRPPPRTLPGTVLMEPPVSDSARMPAIEITPLEKLAPPLGLVGAAVTGLPVDLWIGSDPAVLARLIADAPVEYSPAMQKLLYTLLLSESRPPPAAEQAETLLLARLDRLMELGAVDPAQALVQLAGPTETADRFRRWFDATLLTGDEYRSCAALTAAPWLAPDYAATIFCHMRRGDWQTAALTLEAVHALELLPADRLALLDRFVSPEIFEGAPPLPAPADPDPLTFRLFEAIGERLPTAPLPRLFATADLRDVAGWKAQIEAAERLTRTGAIGPNLLLGLYTERRPAASGGVWERVAAIQDLDAALTDGDARAVATTLPAAWAAMREARLETAFAEMFGERLADLQATSAPVAALIWRIRLLSSGYSEAAQTPPADADADPQTRFLAALARGRPGLAQPPTPRARAIAAGFGPDAVPPARLADRIGTARLGEALLEAIALFDSGRQGNPADLTAALAFFRAAGLEDTAIRAALQLMLLEDR